MKIYYATWNLHRRESGRVWMPNGVRPLSRERAEGAGLSLIRPGDFPPLGEGANGGPDVSQARVHQDIEGRVWLEPETTPDGRVAILTIADKVFNEGTETPVWTSAPRDKWCPPSQLIVLKPGISQARVKIGDSWWMISLSGDVSQIPAPGGEWKTL